MSPFSCQAVPCNMRASGSFATGFATALQGELSGVVWGCDRRLAPIRPVLEAGRRAVEQLRNRCAYRWVSLDTLYNVTATSA